MPAQMQPAIPDVQRAWEVLQILELPAFGVED